MLRPVEAGQPRSGVSSGLFAMRDGIGATAARQQHRQYRRLCAATGIFTAWFGEVGVLYATGVMTVWL